MFQVRLSNSLEPALDQYVEDVQDYLYRLNFLNSWIELSDSEQLVSVLLNKVVQNVVHLLLRETTHRARVTHSWCIFGLETGQINAYGSRPIESLWLFET